MKEKIKHERGRKEGEKRVNSLEAIMSMTNKSVYTENIYTHTMYNTCIINSSPYSLIYNYKPAKCFTSIVLLTSHS